MNMRVQTAAVRNPAAVLVSDIELAGRRPLVAVHSESGAGWARQ
jgi:hypothetical protein